MTAGGITARWHGLRQSVADYLANDDPLVRAANSGAFLVWSSQPLYPLYVWLIVGAGAWPALLTWLSTPVFYSVPLAGRRSGIGGRATFVAAGVANTLLATKALGTATSVGWFLLPCLVIPVGFFRVREWPVALGLVLAVAAAALVLPYLGVPLHAYTAAENTSLSHLNLWSVAVLSLYLVYAAINARRTGKV